VPAGASVLDVACGSGRHLLWFAQRGHFVTGVDHSAHDLQALSPLVDTGQARLVLADIENGPWPLMDGGAPQKFGAVVVTNYLWRPLFATLLSSLQPGGVLLYETFAAGNASVGKPSRPDFLLRPRELIDVCAALHLVACEDGFCAEPARFVQRIVAVRPGATMGPAGAADIPRYLLGP
jgi:SAM-dependent methyltransferase